jgi:hypothetical protein
MNSDFTLRMELQQVPPALPGVEILRIPIEWMRYCGECDADRRFVADRRCLAGLIAVCTGCGDQRLAPFSRANSDDPWESYT